MDATTIDDEESLYRSVKPGWGYTIQDGKVEISASAFDDAERKPSVDRSSIRSNPEDARLSKADGITKLEAHEVRSSCKIDITNNGKPTGQSYAVDVIHRPIKDVEGETDNLAHSQIECAPAIDSGSRFRRLKEALARLATRHGFVVDPS